MRQNQNWIYTRQGDRWVVLPSGILRLEEDEPPQKRSWLLRLIAWLKAWRQL